MNSYGIDKKTAIRRSSVLKTKWIFTIAYADLIDGKKVWRKHVNYISEYFNTKRDAQIELNRVIANH